jgi:hypothetical protein
MKPRLEMLSVESQLILDHEADRHPARQAMPHPETIRCPLCIYPDVYTDEDCDRCGSPVRRSESYNHRHYRCR